MPPIADARPARGRTGGGAAVASLLLFVGLATIHLWPLASAPGMLSRNDNGDFVLHEWIMGWVAHAVATDPLHLFDANIFYPEHGSLSYSDHLFVQGMLGAPLLWAGASPVLVHNLVLIAGFALTGWTACLVMHRWTGSWLAAAGTGSLVAFNAFSLTRLPQIQDLHIEFFPLALYALDRLLSEPRVRHALSLAGWFVLHSLTGTYVMVFSSLSLAAAALARPEDWVGPRFKRVAGYALLAALTAIVLLAPFLLPYYRASAEVGLGRSLEETQRYSAELTDYFAAAGRIHFDILRWSRPYFQGDALFPGFVGLALALVGLAAGGFRDRRIRMLLAIGVVAFALSFGPAFAPYRVLYRIYPLLTGIRGAVRFGQFVLIAVGFLAGFGIAAVQRRLSGRSSVAAALLCVVAVNAEALRAPLHYTEYAGLSPIYDTMSQLGSKAVIVYFPFYDSAHFHMNAPFMLASAATRTFHPMLNGYSGFKPASYYEHVRRLSTFPDRSSLDYLIALGVTHVYVDSRNMRPGHVDAIAQFPELHLWQTDGNMRVYLLTRP